MVWIYFCLRPAFVEAVARESAAVRRNVVRCPTRQRCCCLLRQLRRGACRRWQERHSNSAENTQSRSSSSTKITIFRSTSRSNGRRGTFQSLSKVSAFKEEKKPMMVAKKHMTTRRKEGRTAAGARLFLVKHSLLQPSAQQRQRLRAKKRYGFFHPG